MVELFGLPLHQDHHRFLDQAPNTQSDEEGDEDGTDGISNHPVEQVHENGRDDDTHTSKSVSQDVKKHLK